MTDAIAKFAHEVGDAADSIETTLYEMRATLEVWEEKEDMDEETRRRLGYWQTELAQLQDAFLQIKRAAMVLEKEAGDDPPRA